MPKKNKKTSLLLLGRLKKSKLVAFRIQMHIVSFSVLSQSSVHSSLRTVFCRRTPPCHQVSGWVFNPTVRPPFNIFFQHVECPETTSCLIQSACHLMKQGIPDGKVIEFTIFFLQAPVAKCNWSWRPYFYLSSLGRRNCSRAIFRHRYSFLRLTDMNSDIAIFAAAQWQFIKGWLFLSFASFNWL